MADSILDFIRDERCQNNVECSLIFGLVTLLALVLLSPALNGPHGIWAVGNTLVVAANTV